MNCKQTIKFIEFEIWEWVFSAHFFPITYSEGNFGIGDITTVHRKVDLSSFLEFIITIDDQSIEHVLI